MKENELKSCFLSKSDIELMWIRYYLENFSNAIQAWNRRVE